MTLSSPAPARRPADGFEPAGSILYRATVGRSLATVVAVWTLIAIIMSVLATAAVTYAVRGAFDWRDLAVAAAVSGLVTVPIAYRIGKLMRELNRSRAALQLLAQQDALTGLANRGYFFQRAEQLLRVNAPRPVWPLSALMIDVDHFKSINDESGHAVGDAVLGGVARILAQNLRTEDFVARYGGEEFAALLPRTDRTTAMAIAERMRLAIAEDAGLRGLARRPVTISIGVAETGDVVPVDPVLLAADRALYTAKANGRNRSSFLDVAAALSTTGRMRLLKAQALSRGDAA
jgi:diguanylate cyclase (GGDEF)-like protein